MKSNEYCCIMFVRTCRVPGMNDIQTSTHYVLHILPFIISPRTTTGIYYTMVENFLGPCLRFAFARCSLQRPVHSFDFTPPPPCRIFFYWHHPPFRHAARGWVCIPQEYQGGAPEKHRGCIIGVSVPHNITRTWHTRTWHTCTWHTCILLYTGYLYVYICIYMLL